MGDSVTTSSPAAAGCVDPAAGDGVCKPRVRRRLLEVGRPGGDLVAQTAGRLGTRFIAVHDATAAAGYLAVNDVSCVVLHDSGNALNDVGDLVEARDDVPVVVVGPERDPQVAVAVVQAGAQDYLLSHDLDHMTLERAVRHAIDRHRTRVQLQGMALYDQLTGVANRTLFADRLQQAINRRERTGGVIAVLFVDVDGFKRINDHLGHAAGDRALRAAALRIGGAVRTIDTVARFGGDEFTVLCEDVGDEMSALELGERVASQMSIPIELGAAEVVLRASVGVVVDTEAELTGDELLLAADQAMYRAKHRGGGRAEVWRPGQRGGDNEIRVEAELRRAIPNELRAVYQPQVALADGSPFGAEALVRWEHPERGMVSPGEFIPVAERSGLVVELGRWMLHEACAEARRLEAASGRPINVSVNVSGRQVADEGLIGDVAAALSASGLPAERLCLELTESTLIEDLDAGVALVGRLKELGVTLALDDFGKGYSSLSYLKRLPVDTIKIDRAFVSGVPDCREDVAIVAAVISFARALDMNVLAEGVETKAHVDALLELGCTHAQGFYFHRPLAPDALRDVWANA
jgi:diguanylate cyclase (GGDEF)-like protein